MKLLNDQPLAWDGRRYTLASPDTLGRDELAGQIADVIRVVDPPFTVAVYGTWGEGKTHLLKSVENQVRGFQDDPDHPGRPAFQTVWFDLWQHQHDDKPTLALLQAAVRAVRYDAAGHEQADWPGIWDKVAQVGKALLWTLGDMVTPKLALGATGATLSASVSDKGLVSAFKDNWEALAEAGMQVRDEQARLQELFRDALDALAGEAKIAFFVDDLDRCLPTTTIELLEQIKLFMDHPRCVFVLGVDARAVTEAVRTVKGYTDDIAEHYLEKMIQCAFDLPPVADEANRRFIEDALSRAANPSSRPGRPDVTAGQLDLLTGGQVTAIADLWLPAFRDADVDATPRLIVRTVNTFLVDHAVGRGAVTDRQGNRRPRIPGYDPRVMAALAPLKTCYRAAFDYLRRHHDDRPGLLESLLSTYDGDPLDATVREIVFQGQGRRYIDHVRSRIEAAGLVIDRELAEAYCKLS
jgi:hypothetical protein